MRKRAGRPFRNERVNRLPWPEPPGDYGVVTVTGRCKARHMGGNIIIVGTEIRVALRCAAVAASISAAPVAAQSIDELKSMSIEQLANVDVTSVTKSPEALSGAPGSIHVITRDDIARAGATNLPEALRLAPTLQVARRGSADWVITARGMSGNADAQNFPNKLLVLIDGRSVYTPLYSGVYWDMQDVVLDDVDRIEVISGPGATLWGANAVNGVINIITRKTQDTQGGVLDVGAGNKERHGSLQYGGRLSEDATYRAYVNGFTRSNNVTAGGVNARDGWYKLHGGFRVDWPPE